MNLVKRARKSVRISDISYNIIKQYTKKDCEIVLARYNEDISWSDDYSHLRTIYNKGLDNLDVSSIKVPNVGREAHTFLYHIISNYDNLAENTIFFQGMINDRSEQKILPFDKYLFNSNNSITGNISICYEGSDWNYNAYTNTSGKSDYNLGTFCEKVLARRYKQFSPFIRGAYMSIGKKCILKNSRKYYENILKMSKLSLECNPEDAHFMERLWLYIFLL
jgi:hypothetical protein